MAEKESANRIVLIVQFLAVHSLRLRESKRREENGDSDTKANIMFCFLFFLLSDIFSFPLFFFYSEQELHL